MKLRNKETGKVLRVGEDVYIRSLDSGSIEVREDFGCGNKIEYFKTFAEMFNRYEEIKEPLIKDEKIRKAVRAWAEANEVFSASTYKSCSDGHYWYIRAFNDTERGIDIDLWGNMPKELIDCKCYTIEELCGEEEECEN